SLERFLITKDEIEKATFIYFSMKSKTVSFEDQYEDSKKYVTFATKEHELGQKLSAALKGNNVAEVKRMLCERNKGAEEAKSSRTVENGLSSNSFEIQFVVYRNYNAPEDILLQVSPWESKPDKLRSFMETVKPCYGIDSEAVEVGLAHVNRERAKDGVSQVILIGDSPVNADND
ncbi:hypothetical protein RFI_37184, partial [Reticulomyxa filosa]